MPTLWLHAVSVGETRAAQPLVEALRERYPQHRILFTHMTPTGRATSEALYGDKVDRIYLPYDTPWAVRRFLRHYRPEFGLIMETELWPNLIEACRRTEFRCDWSMPAVATLGAALRELPCADARGAARSDRDRRTVEGRCGTARGARRAEVVVTGNIKFDIAAPAGQDRTWQPLPRGLWRSRQTWLAASTREGEEALILDAWRHALPANGALLVIVPRHPQRFDEVARLAAERGFVVQRRSENSPVAADTEVLIGDSMGEMFAFHAAADLAFIGGSLLDFGSQNLIEAAACGTPILIGPSTRNFAEAAREPCRLRRSPGRYPMRMMVARGHRIAVEPESRARMAVRPERSLRRAPSRRHGKDHGVDQSSSALIAATSSSPSVPAAALSLSRAPRVSSLALASFWRVSNSWLCAFSTSMLMRTPTS
jgi:3-deoxy-D-manno-octulosonic-acid transferase